MIMQKRSRRIETEYQKEQREYAWDLERDFDFGNYKELESALEEADLYCLYYRLINYISYSSKCVTEESLTYKEDDLTFYITCDTIKKHFHCGFDKMSYKQISDKLQLLCDIELLIRIGHDLYLLKDLAPSVIDEAIENLKSM